MDLAAPDTAPVGARLSFEDSRLPPRFWIRVTPEPNTGCWLWYGATTAQGYGNWWADGTMRLTHRQVLESSGSPIPAGLHVDHLCRQRACCNPDHLEPVSVQENTRRGSVLLTACPAGHEYTTENTYMRKGWRHCRACNRARYHARKARLS